ncbi:MAG: hypothetical protein GX235_13270 [Clostridiales bacterium]|nr:hypothetical protein [Clostridiales bacterium]
MYKIVKKSRAIQSVILLFTLLAMLTIYPIRMWDETIPSVSNQILAGSSDSVGEDYLLQRFIAQYNHLGTINLYIADFDNGWNKDQRVDSFIFRMLDSDMQVMFEQKVDVRFIDIPGFCPVYINEDLEVGRDYYFFLQGQNGSRVWFGLEETANAGTQYVSRLVYNYDELQGYNIVGEYYYMVPLRKDKIFAYDAMLLIIAALLAGAVELYFRISKRDKLITVEKAFRYTVNILVTALTGVSLYMVSIRRFFSGQFTDNLFYTIGALLCSATLFYAINCKRDRSKHVPLWDKLKENGSDYLQAAFIAGAVWACCNYMNGLYDIHHRIAERQFIIFFSLVIITMCKKKEIFNKISLVYVVAAVAAAYRYCSIYVDYLAMNELDLQAVRYGVLAVGLAGFVAVTVIARIITMLVRKERMSRISVWYGVILGLFFVLIIAFRNTRWWTVALVISFSLFYIRYALWNKKEHLLQNICNGLILHFVCSVLFALMHRPFLSWVYPRFPFVFHTVTVTAVYLTFIICAAFMKLADKYGKSHKIKDIWGELVILGISGTYMIFTASRTGFMSVAVMLIVAVVMTAKGIGKEKFGNILGLSGLMAAAVIWCFPIIFTGQRIIPALCNDVFKYEVEVFPDAISRGNEWDSMYYITVERFAEVFNNKIFGIPESGTSSYERSEEYQKYRAKRFNSSGEVVWEGGINDLYKAEENDGNASAEAPGNASGEQLNIIGTKTDEERAADDARAAQLERDAQETDFTETEEVQEEIVEETSVYEKTEEYANGRVDIFRAYLDQLNLKGHDEMGALLPDGTLAVHAHNIYLQVAYDHGIFVGIVFIVLGAATFVQGCIFFVRRKNSVACAAMPVAIVVAFAMAGLVEWIFHLCHPAGFTLLVVLAPLLFDMGKKKDEANEER